MHRSTKRHLPWQPGPVVVLGEILCDLLGPKPGVPLEQSASLEPQIGGAPANVAVQLARLGCPVELVSAVGDDPLGHRVLRLLAAERVGVGHTQRRVDRRTGLTLVEVDAAGERHFYPWRERSADLSFRADELPTALLQKTPLLHRGTVSLRSETSRRATREGVRMARQTGALISLDVNLRFGMFRNRQNLCSLARGALREADIVKATQEEAEVLLGSASLDTLVDHLLRLGPRLVLLTMGAAGAYLASHRARVLVAAPRVALVDATGAGDAFMGAALSEVWRQRLGRNELGALDAPSLQQLGDVACRAGAAAVTQLGATPGMLRAADFI